MWENASFLLNFYVIFEQNSAILVIYLIFMMWKRNRLDVFVYFVSN